MNQLHYDENLQVLREDNSDESVNLIYLDPPFNSKRDYNLRVIERCNERDRVRIGGPDHLREKVRVISGSFVYNTCDDFMLVGVGKSLKIIAGVGHPL